MLSDQVLAESDIPQLQEVSQNAEIRDQVNQQALQGFFGDIDLISQNVHMLAYENEADPMGFSSGGTKLTGAPRGFQATATQPATLSRQHSSIGQSGRRS